MKISHLITSGIVVGFLIGLGRLTGFTRELLIAGNFVASKESDLIILILTNPDILINFLIGGALGIVLVPDLKSRNKQESVIYYQKIMLIIASIFIFIWFLISLFSTNILYFLGKSISLESLVLHEDSIRISLLAVPLAACSGVTIAYLHSVEKFVIAASSTLVFNLVIIACLLTIMFGNVENVVGLISISVFVGALCKWIMQIFDSGHLTFSISSLQVNINYSQFLSRYLIGLSCLGVISLFPIYLRTVVSGNGDGFLTLFNYAFKLMELPQGVILSVFSIVFFPLLSKYAEKKHSKIFNSYVSLVTLTILIASLSIAIPAIKYSETISYIAFGLIGDIQPEQLDIMSHYFGYMIIAIPFIGLSSFLIFVFAAKKNILLPFLISITSIIISLFINEFLLTKYGLEVLSLLICHFLITIYLLVFLRFKFKFNVIKDHKKDFLNLPIVALFLGLIIYYFPVFQNEYANLIAFSCFIFIHFLAFTTIITAPKKLLNAK